MMRDYSYAYEWDQEYCYESINLSLIHISNGNIVSLGYLMKYFDPHFPIA